MKKRRLVIASVLKPINDTRMFEKLGVSLSQNPSYEVHIIGYPAPDFTPPDSIIFHSLKPFKRVSWARLMASLKVALQVLKVKPELLIVTTHELLIVNFPNRILFGVKIVYDVQENYYRNILHSGSFPTLIRWPVAMWVRLKESILAPGISWFFLAEKGYEKELSFIGKRFTVLENKALGATLFANEKIKSDQKIRLLFSGTISESTGVFQAIKLAMELHQKNSSVELTIIGFCALEKVREEVRAAVANLDFIHLVGIDKLVPHREILMAIASSDFGIIYYPTSPHTVNSIPTKLYEYLTYRLPILLQNHEPWIQLCSPYEAAIDIDFNHLDPEQILSKMVNGKFYTSTPHDVTWDTEAPKLLQVVSSLLA